MAEVLRNLTQRLRERAVGAAVASGVGVAHRALYDNLAPYHRVMGNLRRFNEGILPLGYAILGGMANLVGWDDALALGIYKEIEAAYDEMARKLPFCFAKDASNIACFNLDPNTQVSIRVDGSAVNVNVSTDASGNVTITLPSALSAGKHKIIVSTTSKAYYGEVVV